MLSETFVAFDTETTGPYPLTWEICEIAGVKWRDGKVVDEFSSFILPQGGMDPVAYGIHGISLDQLQGAPPARDVLAQFLDFIDGTILMAHHAPFDMGFLISTLEREKMKWPTNKVICTSLLSRKVFPQSPNHKLQTLVNYFNLSKRQAHRALDDSMNALLVGLKCLEHANVSEFDQVRSLQGRLLMWKDYSMADLEKSDALGPLVLAAKTKGRIEFAYKKGSKPGQSREIKVMGLVRNPEGDFFIGVEDGQEKGKRFYLDSVIWSRNLP